MQLPDLLFVYALASAVSVLVAVLALGRDQLALSPEGVEAGPIAPDPPARRPFELGELGRGVVAPARLPEPLASAPFWGEAGNDYAPAGRRHAELGWG